MAELMMLKFGESGHPVFRATSPLSRGVRRPGNDWICFSHNCFFLLISSVFTEQWQKCVKNMNLFMIERWDLSWKDNLTHCSCQVWWRHTYLWPMILHNHKKICCKDTKNELKSYQNKIEWANFALMQDSWPQLMSDSISWRKTLKNSRNSQIQWPFVSTHCQEMKVYLNQKVGFEGTLRLDPYWKLQPVAYKVNMKWKSGLCLWTRTILNRGSKFLMAWISWSQTWTTMCKEYISHTAKFYEKKWLRRKPQLQQERWDQVCDEQQLHHKP